MIKHEVIDPHAPQKSHDRLLQRFEPENLRLVGQE